MNRFFVLPAALVMCAFAPQLPAQGRPVTPADQAQGQAWWAHVKALADDSNEGRLTGSEGYLRAARYVVSQFDSAGLKPAGVREYVLPMQHGQRRKHQAEC